MIFDQQQTQPTLFDENKKDVEIERVILFALGDFQSRGKILASRELALDRQRGAYNRSAEKFEMADLTDDAIAEILGKLGAKIVRVPNFVAKHPFRVTVPPELAETAKSVYQNSMEND